MIPNIPQVPSSYRLKSFGGRIKLIDVNGILSAVKWFHNSTPLKRRYKEFKLLLKLQNHPYIVKLLAAGPDYANGVLEYIMTEFAPEGDLYHLIHQKKSVEYNLANALSWMFQLSEALTFLHEHFAAAIIHRDVKPANCLLFNEGFTLKLCDFSSAESSDLSGPLSHTRRGTAGFMAPELFTTDQTSHAAMTFWEILARQHVCPPGEPFFVTLVQLVHNHRRPYPLRGCPVFLLRLLEKSWADEPASRPRMGEIAELLRCIKLTIIDKGLISKPLAIPALSSDPAASSASGDILNEQWQEEDDVVDTTNQYTCVEDCPAQELQLLSTSPVRSKPLELSIICYDDDTNG